MWVSVSSIHATVECHWAIGNGAKGAGGGNPAKRESFCGLKTGTRRAPGGRPWGNRARICAWCWGLSCEKRIGSGGGPPGPRWIRGDPVSGVMIWPVGAGAATLAGAGFFVGRGLARRSSLGRGGSGNPSSSASTLNQSSSSSFSAFAI